jgi:REP element-mobilizing transposase RayT
MPQSYVSLHCHLVFSTKNREPLIRTDWAPRLYQYIGGIVRGQGGCLIAAGGMADHVHLLASLGKTNAVADLVRDVKSNSSRWVHETLANLRGFAWQTGYGAFAVSYSKIDEVKRYIAGQEEHHRVRSFKEEFVAFLERHGIEYDERYVWE